MVVIRCQRENRSFSFAVHARFARMTRLSQLMLCKIPIYNAFSSPLLDFFFSCLILLPLLSSNFWKERINHEDTIYMTRDWVWLRRWVRWRLSVLGQLLGHFQFSFFTTSYTWLQESIKDLIACEKDNLGEPLGGRLVNRDHITRSDIPLCLAASSFSSSQSNPHAMSNSETPAKVVYEANCHCGAIKYQIKMQPLDTLKVTHCNCSICSKNGYLNVYPKREDVVFRCGEDQMKGYAFGAKRCIHRFCSKCGSSLFVDPHMDNPELMVANVCLFFGTASVLDCADWAKVRMFKDVDVDKLELHKYDGFNKLEPRYEV